MNNPQKARKLQKRAAHPRGHKPQKGQYREVFKRVGPPGVYHCPHCGEVLSSDPTAYTCPKVTGTA